MSTNVHTGNNIPMLKQYTAFFAILWLTWHQVGLYNAHFCEKTVIEQIVKALHLGQACLSEI